MKTLLMKISSWSSVYYSPQGDDLKIQRNVILFFPQLSNHPLTTLLLFGVTLKRSEIK